MPGFEAPSTAQPNLINSRFSTTSPKLNFPSLSSRARSLSLSLSCQLSVLSSIYLTIATVDHDGAWVDLAETFAVAVISRPLRLAFVVIYISFSWFSLFLYVIFLFDRLIRLLDLFDFLNLFNFFDFALISEFFTWLTKLICWPPILIRNF